MRAELESIPERDWRPHPQGHPGNSALPLVARGGDPADDGVAGTMLPTPHLEGCPYLRQVLASFETVIGRARLMRLEGNSEATLHVDTNYYWAERVRIHVPILTSPAIEFICNGRSLHMAAGESWIFDAWKRHNVLNPTGDRRIHLVADTVGSSAFWELVAQGERPFSGNGGRPARPRRVAYRADATATLETERANYPVVMSPWEQQALTQSLVEDVAEDADEKASGELRSVLDRFQRDWRVVWARFGDGREGWQAFKQLLDRADSQLAPLVGRVPLVNRTDAVEIARQMLIRPALNPQLAQPNGAGPTGHSGGPGVPRSAGLGESAPAAAQPARHAPRVSAQRAVARSQNLHRFDRPIFIVAPPRSGTSLLFETLALARGVYTVGGESHGLIESLPTLSPANRGWDSNRLTETDAAPPVGERLRGLFLAQLRDRDGGKPPGEEAPLRMLEKTPKNSLRVPFLTAVFPRALFVYLYRDPREALASMVEAWESGRFVTYPELPGWTGPPWSLALTPEWRTLRGMPLAAVVAHQWTMATRVVAADLEGLPRERLHALDYADLISDPATEVKRICEFAGLELDRELPEPLPPSRHIVSAPEPEKWRRRADEIEPVLERVAEAERRGRRLLEPPPAKPARSAAARSRLRSVNTNTFPQALAQLGSSLLVTTYQTGKLICARRVGEGLNTHFRDFDMPMGLAWKAPTLAIGTRSQVVTYQNLPQVTEKLDPAPESHDACLIPRRTHYTGDIRIHDVAYAGDELWVVATRFSCLATLDHEHSFVPRWRPRFVSALAAEDRCHLNGLAVVDDRVRYVTALGESDEPGGWREHKASGGILIDVESSETIVSGLSMPHSPRWYRDRLWLLESGQGTLATVDLDSGEVETVVELPGFTRGLAFAGPLAFVGLSEVREATTFGGLPLTGRLEERQCGVWAVNIETATVVGFLRFEDLVQEIFDVAVLPGLRFPEIAEPGSDAVNLSYVLPAQTQAAESGQR